FIVEYLPSMRAGKDGMASIREALKDDEPLRDSGDARSLPPLEHEIVLDHVHFSYEDGVPALADVSLRIPKGAYIAIVGQSGAGKTTLLNLLMRFYDPDSGRVAVDGHDLKSVRLRSLRAQMGVVLQENFIFNASVRDNVRLGRPDATDESVREAMTAAGL